jgi:hypothetical protein
MLHNTKADNLHKYQQTLVIQIGPFPASSALYLQIRENYYTRVFLEKINSTTFHSPGTQFPFTISH